MLLDELREKVNRFLIHRTDFLKVKDGMNETELREFVSYAIDDLCSQEQLQVELSLKTAVIRELVSAVTSLGPLRPLMEDKSITEIMVNGFNQVYIQRSGKIEITDVKFENNQQLHHTVQKILAGSGSNKRIDESSPYVDFSLPDGSRVNIILPPCSLNGPVLTIRKFKDDIGNVEDVLALEMIDKNIAILLIAAMKAKLNVIFCGSTGAGKTTLMNVFSRHIPAEERIITIEDTPELRLLQEHVVSLSSKPPNIEGKGEITMQDLFINSLRMRPDRIIIGEVRGEELLDLVQSISSGHSGSLAIVHAETAEDCFNRMITMMLMTGIRLSTEEIKKQVARSIDIIVHVELFLDGKRRVTTVTECMYNEENGKITLNNIFTFKELDVKEGGKIVGQWEHNKTPPNFLEKMKKRRINLPEGFFNES